MVIRSADVCVCTGNPLPLPGLCLQDLYSEALMLTPIPTHLALLTVRGDVQLYPILKNQRSGSM